MNAVLLRPLLLFCVFSILFRSTALHAQQGTAVRVTQAVDPSLRVTLRGNTHPLARAEFDQGQAPADLPMRRMLLVLKRSPEQESALRSLLDNQQDKHSPDYHRWVAPQEFGARFGPADADVAAVSNWIKASGFQVSSVSAGRTVVEFSGTAAQVQAAFNTSIHSFAVNGKQHWANVADPQIPVALAPVVVGVSALHNFFKQPQIGEPQKVAANFLQTPVPQVTFSNPVVHGLGPQDYARIYNITPVWNAGIDGTGRTIAVVARSEYDFFDVWTFRSIFGLSGNVPQIVFNGDTPGNLGGGEEAEAVLDATWSGAVAPGATIDFVISASTNSSDGVDLSELYIVDNNLADVMTESFGSCEANASSAHIAFAASLAEQAAAEGITYTVSTGDSGAEGCDRPFAASAVGPVSPNLLSSTPFNVAVGGTMFNEGTQVSKYWGTSPPWAETALSYIPENVWNESCDSSKCGSKAALWSAGGGVSSLFPKPSWQSGVAGIPNDGARDQPDVSLTSAAHDPYLVCLEGSCSQNYIYFFYGTSAAAPSFAGIMAMVDQKTGSRQGQANYVLYRLAAADIAAGRKCNASGTTLPASTCNFNDVTVGNNAVPGEAGFGTSSAKYQSAAGYDLATGLGSVNVANLVNNWSSVTFTPTTTTLMLSPTSITHGVTVTVSATVSPTSGTGVPTGDISLRNADSVQLSGSGLIDAFTLSGGSVTAGTTGFLPGGSYHVVAHYAGDKTFAPSDSAGPIAVTVNPEASATALTVDMVDSTGHVFPYATQPYGSTGYLRADVAGSSGNGIPSGSLVFLDNGNGLGFGSSLNSDGTAATPLGFYSMVPGTHSITAQYGGDSSFSPSTSTPTSVTVTKAATTSTLISSKSAAPTGTQILLTANLATSSVAQGPSGTVTFLSGGVPISDPSNPSPEQGTYGNGNLQTGRFTAAAGVAYLVATLPPGQNVITAQYSGDANYSASTSPATTVNIVADFDLTTTGSPVTVTRGGAGMVTVTIAGHTGYASTINFTATSCAGLPAETTCTFAPASLVGSGSTTLSIKTTAPQTAGLAPRNWWMAGSGGLFAALLVLGAGTRRRRRHWLPATVACSSLILVLSCGGGGGSGPPPDRGTPVGTYSLTVRATDSAGVISHTSTVGLTVK